MPAHFLQFYRSEFCPTARFCQQQQDSGRGKLRRRSFSCRHQLTRADIGAGAPWKMVSAMGALLRRGRALSYSYCHTQAIWASTRLASTTARPSREGRVGPDRVLPANSFTSTYPDGRVEIRYSDRDPRCAEKPISVWTMLNNTADRVPDNIALAVKRNDVWVNWTYRYRTPQTQLFHFFAFVEINLC